MPFGVSVTESLLILVAGSICVSSKKLPQSLASRFHFEQGQTRVEYLDESYQGQNDLCDLEPGKQDNKSDMDAL